MTEPNLSNLEMICNTNSLRLMSFLQNRLSNEELSGKNLEFDIQRKNNHVV